LSVKSLGIGEGKIKGNCDADLVLKCAVDFYEKKFDDVVLVSGDGDYASLASFLREKNVFKTLISPSNNCSFLLRKLNIPIVYLNTQKSNLVKNDQKEKAPDTDETV
jgi:uncharacterized LabA/DUF88 family protein